MRPHTKSIALVQNILPRTIFSIIGTSPWRNLRCTLLLMLFLPVLFSSCSGAPPEIAQLFWQLNIVQDSERSTQHEELSLFVHAQDPDGTGDLEEIELVHPEAELRWNFTPDNWQKIERDGEVWLGGNGVKSGFAAQLPRGEYQVKVLDKAAETAATSFFISKDIQGLQKGNLKASRFPRINTKSDSIELYFTAPEVLLSFYDENEQFLRSQAFTAAAEAEVKSSQFRTVTNWRSKWPNAATIWIQEYDTKKGIGLVSGPYRLPQSE